MVGYEWFFAGNEYPVETVVGIEFLYTQDKGGRRPSVCFGQKGTVMDFDLA